MSKNVNELVNEVQQLLGSEFICTQKTIQKNNTKLNAITIRAVGDVIGEVFYVDSYKEKTAAKEIVKSFKDTFHKEFSKNIGKTLSDWDLVKDKIRIRFTADNNYADNYIHKIYANLYAVPYIAIPSQTGKQIKCEIEFSMNIADAHLFQYGVTKDEIFKVAIENMEHDAQMLDLAEVIFGFSKSENLLENVQEYEKAEEKESMVCVTNTEKMLGASYILLEKVQKKLEGLFPKGCYLLPSSIHEFIVVPKTGDPKHLKEMVQDINEDQVEPEERLSDDIYYFKNGVLTIVQ